MLSTFPPKREMVTRNSSNKKTRKYELIQLSRPSNIGTYNHGMGGTDSGDQKQSYYRTKLRTKKWQTRIITHFLGAAVVNAHIKWNHDTKKDEDLLMFIDKLIDEMVETNEDDCQTLKRKADIFDSGAKKSRVSTDFGSFIHLPSVLKYSISKGSKDPRRNCACCLENGRKTRILTKCATCDKFLCFDADSGKSCFEVYHSNLNTR